MKKSDVIEGIKDCEAEMRSRGVRALYLFGSVKHDVATTQSDVDLIVDYDPDRKFSLLDLVGMKHLLEDRLHRSVDLLTQDGIHHRLRGPILAEAERIF